MAWVNAIIMQKQIDIKLLSTGSFSTSVQKFWNHMPTIFWVIGIYSLLIVAGSLCGGTIPLLVNLTHRRMQLVISLVAGLMLGVGVFHMIPHGISELDEMEVSNSIDQGMLWMMFGFDFHVLHASGISLSSTWTSRNV